MCTNKRIHGEARSFFYSTNKFIRLTLYCQNEEYADRFLLDSNLCFFPSTPDRAGRCKSHGLDIAIERGVSRRMICCVIFPYQQLEVLLGFLRTVVDANSRFGLEHSLELRLSEEPFSQIPGRDKQLFLEPWRKLHSFKRVKIVQGRVPEQVTKELETYMQRDAFEPNQWLRDMVARKEKAALYFKQGNLDKAIYDFEHIIVIMITYYASDGDSRAAQLNAQGPAFATAVNRLRFQTELNIALTRYKLSERPGFPIRAPDSHIEVGLFAAQYALSLCEPKVGCSPWQTDCPPPNDFQKYSIADRAKAYYRVGMAMKRLEIWDDAYCSFAQAHELAPDDSAILAGMKYCAVRY